MNKLGYKTLLVTAMLAGGPLLSTAVSAQMTGPADMQGSAVATAPLAKADTEFLNKAAISGMTEVAAAQLASQKSNDPAIKSFASTMATDHGKANDDLKLLAASKGVTLPTSIDAEHQKVLDKLQSASNADFDKQYSAAMKSAHKDAVSLFEKTAKHSKDADIKAYAMKTLPTLKSHEQMVGHLNM